jgi:hypothetical protein
MLEVYQATNDNGEKRCGYFDALVTNGGPQQFEVKLSADKIQKRKDFLEQRQKEDNREARHLLADQLGIDVDAEDQSTVHERRLLARIHDFSHIHNKLLELERWFKNNVDFESYFGLDLDEEFLDEDQDESSRHRRSTNKKVKQERFNIWARRLI